MTIVRSKVKPVRGCWAFWRKSFTMANFLNNLTSQLNSAFNSPIGLKIGKCLHLIIKSNQFIIQSIGCLLLFDKKLFAEENYWMKKQQQTSGELDKNNLRCPIRKSWRVKSVFLNFAQLPTSRVTHTSIYLISNSLPEQRNWASETRYLLMALRLLIIAMFISRQFLSVNVECYARLLSLVTF